MLPFTFIKNYHTLSFQCTAACFVTSSCPETNISIKFIKDKELFVKMTYHPLRILSKPISDFVKRRTIETYKGYIFYKDKQGGVETLKPNGKKFHGYLGNFPQELFPRDPYNLTEAEEIICLKKSIDKYEMRISKSENKKKIQTELDKLIESRDIFYNEIKMINEKIKKLKEANHC